MFKQTKGPEGHMCLQTARKMEKQNIEHADLLACSFLFFFAFVGFASSGRRRWRGGE